MLKGSFPLPLPSRAWPETGASLLLLTLLVSACGDGEQVTDMPLSPARVATELSGTRFPTLDDVYLQYARTVPGFAGVVFDGEETIVRLANRSSEAVARRELAAFIRESGRNPVALRFTDAAYAWPDLYSWRHAASGIANISSLDIEERENLIVVGVEDASIVDQVGRQLDSLGIPSDARRVIVEEPVKNLSSLRDRVRPVLGGLKIDGSQGDCTAGFNVQWSGDRTFMTNSHCTAAVGSLSGATAFYQNSVASGNFVGTETVDPPMLDYGSVAECNQLYNGIPLKCRYSDAALVRYDNGVSWSFGHIAKTTSSHKDVGSLSISGRFWITSTKLNVGSGETVHKIGQRTGWTYGEVLKTCVHRRASKGTYVYWLICQNISDAGVDDGDSGSPVFIPTGGGTVQLVGILWGGTQTPDSAYFSPMAGLQTDFNTYLNVETTAPTPPSTPSISGPTLIKPDATCLWTTSSSGTTPITYQWYNDGINVGSGTSYTGGNLNPSSSSFVLKVIASNDAGSSSDEITVTESSTASQCIM